MRLPFTLTRTRPRGTRPEIPAATPGTAWPGSGQYGAIALPPVSDATVMGLPAANRARNLIANAVAQMAPLDLWTPDGFVSEDHPPLITRPNSTYTTFDFWFMAVCEAIMHGNFVGLWADFDASGYAQQVVPIPRGFYNGYYDEYGYVTYSINGQTYSREQVCHVRANSAPGRVLGVGVVTQFRRSIGQALDQQNFAADTYRSGSVPAGVIDLDLPEVDPVQAEAVTSQWFSNHAGGRAPAVLPNTMKFTPLQWSPEDMQFLEAQVHNIGNMALMFNMDPTDLGASFGSGSALTYQNIEQRETSRIVNTYAPWMLRFEQEFSDQLPGGNTTKFRPANLLRTDAKTLAEVEQLEIANKTTTADEARKARGKRPLSQSPDAPDRNASPLDLFANDTQVTP